jgi:hypothetical protein
MNSALIFIFFSLSCRMILVRKKSQAVLMPVLGWSRKRIFLFREIRNNDESDFNFAKFREISLYRYFISRNFTKFHINYFAKLFRYVNFPNTNTFREISYKLFSEIVSLCKFFKSNTFFKSRTK